MPTPQQDEHLPDQIEAFAHQAGLTVQRRLFQVLIEKADQDLVLQHRHGNGGAAIQRRGTRPFTVTTIFGEVTVQRSRIRHNYDGTMEIPSATAWDTSHELTITQNLRDAVCDQRSDQSAGKSRADVCQDAGDENLLGRSTVVDIVPQEGEQLIVAQRAARRAVLVAGLRYAFAEATAEGPWLQVSALLLQLGVLSGERRLLVLGDGAAGIRTWFESLGISLQAMIVCWWHLRKRCSEPMSSAGGPKDLRRAVEKELVGPLWEGKVTAAIEHLKGAWEWVRNPAAVEELLAYLEQRRAYIPDYQQRQRAGLWIASTRVEQYNDWAVSARCKHQGMSWSPHGVLALAALEAARRNGELDGWRRDRALPDRPLPEPMGNAA